jgi:hypothetical protein
MTLSDLIEPARSIGYWMNNNQGMVSVGIFILTLVLGWCSGIFGALRRRPKFTISTLPGPTFTCTYPIGTRHNNYEVHRTGIAIYLRIANIGTAPSMIEQISVGYHWDIKPISWLWLKYAIGWYWLKNPTVALSDFKVQIGENVKFYPFLLQNSVISGSQAETFLEPGRSSSGVIYFEQVDSWGGCFPKSHNGEVVLKISVTDIRGKKHLKKLKIPAIELTEAKKFNPKFGRTLVELHDGSSTWGK